jgi:hypothetical protein
MTDFLAVTACNQPKLKDHMAVERIIAGYFFDPDFNVGTLFDEEDGRPMLFVYGYVWPEAWKLPADLAREDFDPYSSDSYEEGADGFIELLREFAPHLDQPLVVQAIGNEKCRYPLAACQWHVEPGGSDAEVSEFGHPCTTTA